MQNQCENQTPESTRLGNEFAASTNPQRFDSSLRIMEYILSYNFTFLHWCEYEKGKKIQERERERENVICWMKPSSMVIYLYDPSRQLASYIRTIKLVEMRERRRKYFWGRMQQHLAPSKLDKKIYTTISVTNRPMKLENCSEEAPRLMAFLIGCFIIEPSKLFSAEKLLLMTPSLLHLLSSSATMHGYSSEESQFASVFPSPPIPLSFSLSLSLFLSLSLKKGCRTGNVHPSMLNIQLTLADPKLALFK